MEDDRVMPKKPPPPTYVDQMLAELTDIETAYASILDNSQVRERQLDFGDVQVFGHPWAWVPSTPEAEASRMELLRQVRDWAPRFRLFFPHPTPAVQRRMDDGIRLLEDWLVREARVKNRAPKDITAAALRELVQLLPQDDWPVRLVVDTNALMDDPDVTVYQDAVDSPRYMVHLLPVVLREIDDLKRSHSRPERREAAKKADRRLKAMRDHGDVRNGARWTPHLAGPGRSRRPLHRLRAAPAVRPPWLEAVRRDERHQPADQARSGRPPLRRRSRRYVSRRRGHRPTHRATTSIKR
jgi:hypothetical protein